MKSQIKLSIIILAFFGVLIPHFSFAHNTDTEKEIIMTEQGFEPSKVEIPEGGTVEFVNKSGVERWPASNFHPSHLLYPEFDPKQGIKDGETWTFKFEKVGVWKFHDHLFPQFSGTVTVKAVEAVSSKPVEAIVNSSQDHQNIFVRFWDWLKNLFKHSKPQKNTEDKKQDSVDLAKYQGDIEQGSEKIFSDDISLGVHLKKYGVKETITSLRLLESKLGSCHQAAHRAGHIGYKMFGDKAFVEYGPECQSGYYHGVLEAYFQEHGTENIKDSVDSLCKGSNNSFFEHQCVHGIGHGLEAWANYELLDALAACDQLSRRQDSCWGGVFMENLAAQLSGPVESGKLTPVGETDVHVTKYLKNDDPLYPCDFVEDKYKNSCYFLQTSRMMQIFGVDFKKIAESCGTAPEIYQGSCFGSMGRDVGGAFPRDSAREIKECGFVKDAQMRILCLSGAVQNGFWDSSGQDFAIGFCKQLTQKDEKMSCYSTVFSRIPEIIFDAKEKQAVCEKVETFFVEQCKQISGI